MIISTDLLMLASDGSRGIAIAIAGMSIVAIALSLITLFIATLPRILAALETYLPDVDDVRSGTISPESDQPEDDAVTAAIGFVLHTELQKQLAADRPKAK